MWGCARGCLLSKYELQKSRKLKEKITKSKKINQIDHNAVYKLFKTYDSLRVTPSKSHKFSTICKLHYGQFG